jgi:hypothetical protein
MKQCRPPDILLLNACRRKNVTSPGNSRLRIENTALDLEANLAAPDGYFCI